MSATTIEQLELQVQSNSTSAVSGINALSNSLAKLKTAATGGVSGLTTTARQINTLSSALSSFDGASADKITKLSNALSSLRNISGISISKTLVNNLNGLSSAASNINGDFSGLKNLGSALSSLSGLGKASGLTSALNALKKIPEITASLNTSVISDFTNRIEKLVNALTPLASKINTVSTAFSKLPSNITKITTATNKLATSNNTATTSYTNLAAKIGLTSISLHTVLDALSSCVTQANKYIEDYNLFQVSMGQYASEAEEYANKVSSLMGIDVADWMRNQGTFNTIIKGFGVATDKANTMSKTLTELGYDISSFYNISVEDAMAKLQSGIAGELEPLRRIGYDLSVARLQQEAYNLGIEKSVSEMTQAEKSQLRYHAILTQVTDAQGDMARTINSPANQLRVLQAQVTQCARAIGNIFLPILSKILPYALAAAKAIRVLADTVAGIFGFKLTDYTAAWDSMSSSVTGAADSVSDVASGVGDVASGLDDATKAAKELKNATIGIDELNIISPNDTTSTGSTGSSGGSGDGGTGLSGLGDLGLDPETYNFLGDLQKQADELQKKFEKILPVILSIGAALLAWKISNSLMNTLSSIQAALNGISGFVTLGGLLLLIKDLDDFTESLEDFLANGATFDNVTGMLSNFVGMMGDISLMSGNVKLASLLKMIQGVADIVRAIKDISDNGFNSENVEKLVKGISNVIISIGLYLGVKSGNFQLAGVGLVLQGVSGIIGQIDEIKELITTGDWEGVDKAELLIDVIMIIGGIATACGALGKIKTALNVGSKLKPVETAVTEVSTAAGTMNTALSGSASSTMVSLVKNIGLGVVIIGEIAAAAVLLIGAIALMGYELGLVAEAWQPVMANSDTVIAAMAYGVLIMANIGTVTYALGTTGTTLALQMGAGTLILAELAVATDLFLAEIWVIGVLLNQIYEAWQPVNTNGGQIAQNVLIGTGLLIAIGVATALLGVATVASAGLLPIAIGLGTALLVELAAAFVLFCESLIATANELSGRLSPSLKNMIAILPGLSADMTSFTTFMKDFAGKVVSYSTSSVVSGIAATIDTIIGWFTEDPLTKLANDVESMQGQAATLKEKLLTAVPELSLATTLLSTYYGLLAKIESLTGTEVTLSNGCFVDMTVVGQNIVTGFVAGIQSKADEFAGAATSLINAFQTALTTEAIKTKTAMVNWANNLKAWFTESRYGGVNAEKWKTYAKTITNGFSQGINGSYTSCRSAIINWANYVKNTFNSYLSSNTFYNIGVNVLQGFVNGISNSSLWQAAVNTITDFSETVITAAENAMEIGSPSKVFKEMGSFVIEGFNNGIKATMGTSYNLMSSWANTVSSYTPTLAMAADVPSYVSTPRINEAVVADVQSAYTVNNDGFTDNLETFYHDYIEPTLKSIATDTKRQADKNEQTIVKVGDRTIANAVTRQQKANGYSFVG